MEGTEGTPSCVSEEDKEICLDLRKREILKMM